jgi:prevent-host-death family protein
MSEVGVHQAKTHLSRLLKRVAMGEEIVITSSGEPVARLVPVDKPRTRILGIDRDVFLVPDDFNDPLPEDLLDEFES